MLFIRNSIFLLKFKISNNFSNVPACPIKPLFLYKPPFFMFSGTQSWYNEYVRMSDQLPMVLTDVLEAHSHQVKLIQKL